MSMFPVQMRLEGLAMLMLLGCVQKMRDAAANWRQAVIMALTDPYRPELHYMRGPGPKWRQKHPAWPGR
jgi:hypothetical protein